MKSQPQLLLESVIPQPLPEWVHQEWTKEIAAKWAIRGAGERLADSLREATQDPNCLGYDNAVIALAQWEKLLNESTKPVV